MANNVPTNMLCKACQAVVDGRLTFHGFTNYHKPLQRVYRHHLRSYDIEHAASAGCVICSIIWSHFTTTERDLVRQDQGEHTLARQVAFSNPVKRWHGLTEIDYSWYGWFAHSKEAKIVFIFGPYASKVVEILLCPVKEEGAFIRGRFDMLPSAELWKLMEDGQLADLFLKPWREAIENDNIVIIDSILLKTPIAPSLDSPRNWALLDWWHQECGASTDAHRYCHASTLLATEEYPTRLLDVGSNSDSSQPSRLVTDRSTRSELPCVTLSYTWGPAPDLKSMTLLRRNTLALFTQGIDANRLPQLFRDAIWVTRRLGYRYIWMDALCIIQDSSDDFRRETKHMGQIYQGGALNIAAGGAENSQSSLFTSRSPILVQPFTTRVDWSAIPGHLRAKEAQEYLIIDADFLSHNMDSVRLNQRAWVLQEQVLARRTLHFGKEQLFWQCCRNQFCETWPNGMLDLPPFQPERRIKDAVHGRLADKRYWNNIVARYSQCGITKLDDTLLAVSGLANVFAAMVGTGPDDYLAGVWGQSLPSSLLWHVANGKQTGGTAACRPEQYLAPSWSWASVRGKITYHGVQSPSINNAYEGTVAMVSIRDVFVLPTDMGSAYGQVREGHISMLASLKPSSEFGFTWRASGSEDHGFHNYNSRRALHGGLRLSLKGVVFVCIFDDFADHDRRKVRNWLPVTWNVKDIWFVPILQRPERRWTKDSMLPAVEGLLLAAHPGGRAGEFTRVGYFMSSEDKSDSENYSKHVHVFASEENNKKVIVIR